MPTSIDGAGRPCHMSERVNSITAATNLPWCIFLLPPILLHPIPLPPRPILSQPPPHCIPLPPHPIPASPHCIPAPPYFMPVPPHFMLVPPHPIPAPPHSTSSHSNPTLSNIHLLPFTMYLVMCFSAGDDCAFQGRNGAACNARS